MNKKILVVFLITTSLTLMTTVSAKPYWDIKSGEIWYSGTTTPIELGYDQWGYNYQGHIYNGFYGNYQRPTVPVFEGTWLQMKWNDAWLSNRDYDKDHALDRHYGYVTYIDSEAWLTNHMWGISAEDVSFDVIDFDTTSEAGHNLVGWSNQWDWSGGYGGADDGTFRLLLGPGDGCDDTYRDAYFEFDTGHKLVKAHTLKLTHLDGIADDSFDVYIHDGTDFVKIGGYTDVGTTETWYTTDFTFPEQSGLLQFKLVATGALWSGVCSWGQVAISEAELITNYYWDYFVKIVSVFSTDVLTAGIWYRDGVEIGPVIWGSFAVIQEVENDPYYGISGIQYNAPAPTGFGVY
jgi:hypothetical protein